MFDKSLINALLALLSFAVFLVAICCVNLLKAKKSKLINTVIGSVLLIFGIMVFVFSDEVKGVIIKLQSENLIQPSAELYFEKVHSVAKNIIAMVSLGLATCFYYAALTED